MKLFAYFYISHIIFNMLCDCHMIWRFSILLYFVVYQRPYRMVLTTLRELSTSVIRSSSLHQSKLVLATGSTVKWPEMLRCFVRQSYWCYLALPSRKSWLPGGRGLHLVPVLYWTLAGDGEFCPYWGLNTDSESVLEVAEFQPRFFSLLLFTTKYYKV